MKANHSACKILASCFAFLFAQNIALSQYYEWAESLGSTSYDYGNSIAASSTGDVYCTGGFQGIVDFDPGPGVVNLSASGSSLDIYIQKLNSSGGLVWVKKIGANSSDQGRSISTDSFGNVYICGTFRLSVDFDPGIGNTTLVNSSSSDIGFILKLNSNGDFVWVKKIDGSHNEPSLIKVDDSNNIVISGIFYDNINSTDFDPGPGNYPLVSAGGADVFWLKLDNAGDFLWAAKVGGYSPESIQDFRLDADGNVHSVGHFSHTADFDPGPNVYNVTGTQTAESDSFYLELDSDGNFTSLTLIPGLTAYLYFHGIELDESGNVYICGHFDGTVDFDPGPGIHTISSFGTNGFAVKLDASNNYLQSTQVGDYHTVYPRRIFVDETGLVTIVGEFYGPVDWDVSTGVANLYSSGAEEDIFFLKLSSTFSFVSIKKIGGTNVEDLYEASTDLDGNLYLAGNFTGTSDFDPDDSIIEFSAISSYDAFFIKLSMCQGTSESISTSACDSLTINDQTYFTSGLFSQTLVNSTGCDSTLSLDLSIFSSSYVSIDSEACESFSLNGELYTESGIYTQMFINENGCDSTLTLDLTILEPSEGSLTIESCYEYSLNDSIYYTSGLYTQYLTNNAGCDSILTLDLSIYGQTGIVIDTSACESFSLNDQTYTASGSYIQALNNSHGCDSLIFLELTIHDAATFDIDTTACESFSLNDETYFTSGIYVQNLFTNHGCDSTLTIDLTINNPTNSEIDAESCGSYTMNGETYNSSGVYNQLLTNSYGCDSIITLNLTIYNSPIKSISEIACNSFIINGETFTSSGIYTQLLTTANGCDSTLTIHLTINSVDVSVMVGDASFIANSTTGTYQWLDCNDDFAEIPGETNQIFTPTVNGDFAVAIEDNGCVDTSDCVNMSAIGIFEKLDQALHIYPNPSYSAFTISFGSEQTNLVIDITDAYGNLVHRQTFSGLQCVIDRKNLIPGVYLVQSQNGQGLILKKKVVIL